MRSAAPLLFALMVGACAPSPPDLFVDLRTDQVGDPLYVDPSADDYRPSEASPAAERGVELEDVPFDAAGLPYGAGARAAGAHAVP